MYQYPKYLVSQLALQELDAFVLSSSHLLIYLALQASLLFVYREPLPLSSIRTDTNNPLGSAWASIFVSLLATDMYPM